MPAHRRNDDGPHDPVARAKACLRRQFVLCRSMLALTRKQTVSAHFRDFTAMGDTLRQKQGLMAEFQRVRRRGEIDTVIANPELDPGGRAELRSLVNEVLGVFRELLQLETGCQRGGLEELIESRRRERIIHSQGIGARAGQAYAAASRQLHAGA